MATSRGFTLADLEVMPEDGNRYEIIGGELHVTTQPSWGHQLIATRIAGALDNWSWRSRAGVANSAPGVILSEDTAVAPDDSVGPRSAPRLLRVPSA